MNHDSLKVHKKVSRDVNFLNILKINFQIIKLNILKVLIP